MEQFTLNFDIPVPVRFCPDFDIASPAAVLGPTPPAPQPCPAPATPSKPSQAWQGDLPSFAEALDFLKDQSVLSKTSQRDLRSALISAAKILGQAPRDIRLDLRDPSETKLAKTPKLRELKVKRRRNILAGLNKIAALMGVAEAHKPEAAHRSADWQALYQRLAHKY